ncbi:MAG: YfhO family protein [Ruminococcus sp.]|nr:YfhO family protein [Ruminococcus sp.]
MQMVGKWEENKKNIGQTALTAMLALGLFALLFLIRDLFPLGDGSILMIDLHSQYVPLLYRFYDVVTGQKNLFMDLNASGGAYLYADTINEMINPFNYILLLFGRERIYLAVNVLLACYGTASAVSACVFLQKLWPERNAWNIPLSICYAFSAFCAGQFQIIKWMYLPVLFPLFLLACLRLLREKKWGMYALLLGYQLALSLQLGAMTLLFTLFGSGFCFAYKRKADSADEIKRTVSALVIGTVTGVLLSAFVLLPNAIQLLHSARSGENQSYFDVMRQHGLNDLFERIYQFAHPVLLAMAAGFVGKWFQKKLPRECAILIRKHCRAREKRYSLRLCRFFHLCRVSKTFEISRIPIPL